MFAQNCWYVAANKEEVTATEPFACTVADQDIVLYRNKKGNVVGMADRCPHRLAPLSLGRIEDDEIRCMYHGIKFDTEGTCTEIPGQEKIPNSFCVKTFTVIERYEWVWVWIGDQNKMNESSLPDIHAHNPDEWIIKKDAIDYEANYQLLNDNLCDLSHLAFVHETTLGSLGGSDDWAKYKSVITNLDNGVKFDRWFIGKELTKPDGTAFTADIWITYDYILPGILLMQTGMFAPGTAEQSSFKHPEGHTPFTQDFSAQAVTPKSESQMRYFYSVSIPKTQPVQSLDFIFNMSKEAFLEDKLMIESQQKVINKNPDIRLAATTHDQASLYFRRLVKKASEL